MGIPMSCVQIMGKSLLPGDVFPREEFPTTNQQAAQHTRSTTAAHGMVPQEQRLLQHLIFTDVQPQLKKTCWQQDRKGTAATTAQVGDQDLPDPSNHEIKPEKIQICRCLQIDQQDAC